MSASEDDSFMIDDKKQTKEFTVWSIAFLCKYFNVDQIATLHVSVLKQGNILHTILGVASYFHPRKFHYVFPF